jgi:AcrR family transcriptional regulator
MGRPQAFDTTDAVRAARQVFWTHGYEEAAMPAIEEATGLCRSSIYHAFGSKRGLFDAAVASYLEEVVRPRLRPLIEAPVAPEAITDYLMGLRASIEHLHSKDTSEGCLLVNTAASPLAEDAAVKQTIFDYRRDLSAALRSGLHARHPQQSTTRIEQLSQTCTALIIAAFSIAKADPVGAAGYLDLALELAETP